MHIIRPAPPRVRRVAPAPPPEDEPEIVMVGLDENEQETTSIHVVPVETANQGLLDALDAFDEMVGVRPSGGRTKTGAPPHGD
jgi:hypothetical protein